MNSNPLVSIVVITYNSAKYVMETLESALSQTYRNVEIIISDDCSTDNTYDICKHYIDNKNIKQGRVRCILTKTHSNGGICANYNNGLRHARGEWIKYIAGDDILEPDCIEEFVRKSNATDHKLYVCNRQDFCASGLLRKSSYTEALFNGDSRRQERMINRGKFIISGPTLFIHRDTLISLGGFDEKYPYIEDYPIAMKFLKHGFNIGLLEKTMVRYRVYPESVSRADSRFADSIYRAYEDYGMASALRNRQYLIWWHEYVRRAVRNKQFNTMVLYTLSALDVINVKEKILKLINRR